MVRPLRRMEEANIDQERRRELLSLRVRDRHSLFDRAKEKGDEMKAVWKFELDADDYNEIELPAGAKPLTVMGQRGRAQLWCLVDPNETVYETRVFRLAGTGHPIRENVEYIGTFQLYGGSFVGHLFEVKS